MLEDSILNMLDKDYQINPEKIAESVKNCKLDKYYATYYLAIKNEKTNQKHTNSHTFDRFKKQKKSSSIKLIPI